MKILSIVIPCYNEARNIPLILERFEKVITREDIEVLLVNNGSLDDSGEILSQLAPDYPFVRVITVDVNQGYGNGVLKGMDHASGSFLAWSHADMQTDPYDVIRALEILENQSNPKNVYVKGERRGRPLFDELFTFGMSVFETLLMGRKLWDINAQPNMFHRSFYESWNNPPEDFSLDLFVYFNAVEKGFEVKRFDVTFPDRIHGESSWNDGLKAKFKFIKRTVDFSLTLRRKLN